MPAIGHECIEGWTEAVIVLRQFRYRNVLWTAWNAKKSDTGTEEPKGAYIVFLRGDFIPNIMIKQSKQSKSKHHCNYWGIAN